jgi:hypothetical protein
MSTRIWRVAVRSAVAAAAVATASCGDLTRQGTSPAYLRVNELVAASGAEPDKFGATLFSDVVTLDKDTQAPSIFADLGKVTFQLGLKDPGPATGPTNPSANNFITLDRYHVEFIRADGRSVQGVDVPYAFDGGMSATVQGEMEMSFELVRHAAKQEAPLSALKQGAIIINTLARVTFYGHDQTGRAVTTTATVSVEFGNFADPK